MKYISGLMTAASGSVGGCTFSRNRSCEYVRARVVPVNPASSYQTAVRAYLASLVASWTSVLTPAERAAWDAWAYATEQSGWGGKVYKMTGQNAYIKMNALRLQLGVATTKVAPSVSSGAILTPPGIVSATGATEVLSISFTNTDAWATAVGGYLGVYIGRPQNPSVNFFKGPYRYMGKISGAVTPPTSPLPITSTFPFAAGQNVFAQFRACETDARISIATRTFKLAV
jgi:hypothetical protein